MFSWIKNSTGRLRFFLYTTDGEYGQSISLPCILILSRLRPQADSCRNYDASCGHRYTFSCCKLDLAILMIESSDPASCTGGWQCTISSGRSGGSSSVLSDLAKDASLHAYRNNYCSIHARWSPVHVVISSGFGLDIYSDWTHTHTHTERGKLAFVIFVDTPLGGVLESSIYLYSNINSSPCASKNQRKM